MGGHRNITQEIVFGQTNDKIPRWGILDPLNAFVTSTVYDPGIEGWTGEMERILVYHFLDGSGSVHPSLSYKGDYVNLFDLFYVNAKLNLSSADVDLWQQDDEVKQQLLFSRQPSAPESLHDCRMV